MKSSELNRIRRTVTLARCPDCNRHRLQIQDIVRNVVSVLCSSCGWFSEDWRAS